MANPKRRQEKKLALPSTFINSQQKGRRFAFRIEDDLVLLKSCLQHNPFQLGNDKWTDILTDVTNFNSRRGITVRGLKDRVQLLRTKYESEQLTCKTGTEESQSERASLLDEVNQLIVMSEAPINPMSNPENLDFVVEEVELLDYDTLEPVASLLSNSSKTSTSNKRQAAMEKVQADKEREHLLADQAPSPTETRKKRLKLSPEDEIIKAKQESDYLLEVKKLDLEEKKGSQNFELEKAKLELEKKKEERLAEESKRRDEIAAAQLESQREMYKLIQLFAKSKE